jgi:hypothetical protein
VWQPETEQVWRPETLQLYMGVISAAPSLGNSARIDGPVIVRRITFRCSGGNQNLLRFRPDWNLTGSGISDGDTPLTGPFGNTDFLHNPLTRSISLRFEHVVTAPSFHFRLAAANPIAPMKFVYSSWLYERGTGMNLRQGTVSVAPFFEAALAANARTTLVSSTPVPYAFAVDEVLCIFATGVQGNLRLSLWVEDNDGAPTLGPPDGRPLISGFGNITTLRGDNAVVRIRPSDGLGQMIVRERGMFLKVHAKNIDTGAAHDVNVIVTIRQLIDFQG